MQKSVGHSDVEIASNVVDAWHFFLSFIFHSLLSGERERKKRNNSDSNLSSASGATCRFLRWARFDDFVVHVEAFFKFICFYVLPKIKKTILKYSKNYRTTSLKKKIKIANVFLRYACQCTFE